VLKLTDIATKEIVPGITGNRHKIGTKFIFNPATGALELPADLGLKVIETLGSEARGCQFRAYLRLPGLYLCQLGFQARYAALRIATGG
jgi:hypothetical protein